MKKEHIREYETHCTNCHKTIDAHTGINAEDPPQKGDLSVCIYCGAISEFDSDLNLRPLTDEELIAIKVEDEESWALLTKASRWIHNRNNTVN